jgi:hypothetical protein
MYGRARLGETICWYKLHLDLCAKLLPVTLEDNCHVLDTRGATLVLHSSRCPHDSRYIARSALRADLRKGCLDEIAANG